MESFISTFKELLNKYKELKEENELLRAQNRELHIALTYIRRRR